MINVMLVEDEPPVMRMFENLLKNHNKNYNVIGRAFNGKRALDILKNEEVDIVFADIKMPVMGGLELASEIQKKYPDIYTVLVSGFQEFDYARRAIQYGVYDYLLKPVSKETLGTLLDKLEVTVNVNKKEKKHNNLFKAINDNLNEQNNLPKTDCILLLICAGSFPLSYDDSMLPSRAFWDGVNLEALTKDILGSKDNVMIFNGKTSSEKVIIVEEGKNEFVETLFNRLNQPVALPVTIASLGYTVNINKVSEALRTLRTKLFTKIHLCRKSLIFLKNDESEKQNSIDASALTDTIISVINSNDKERIKNTLIEMLEEMQSADITQLEIVGFLKGIASKILYASDPFDKNLISVNIDIEEAISNTISFISLANDITSIFSQIKEKNNTLKQENTPDLINRIEAYLQKNYTDTITNSTLSNEFGFVPSYISRLFKSYKGVSPGEYLTNYRINKAKQLMKENPSLMVKEISQIVGINDQYYFSKLFKKETGQWPTEYLR